MVFTVFSNLKHLQHSDIYLRPEKTIHAGFTFIWQQNKQKSGGGNVLEQAVGQGLFP